MTTTYPDNAIYVISRSCRPSTDVSYRNVGEYLKNLKGSQSLRD